MKKFFYSVLAVVFAALTFTSCDDVPMPYAQPEVNGGGQTYEGAEGDGTLENPYNVAGALQFISGLEAGVNSENAVYIKGTISSIEEEFGSFGNATFYITDPGTNYTFYVYRTLFLNNQNWKTGNTQIQIGDEVIICGKVVNFKGTTPETVAKESYVYKLNDETSTGGGGGTPSGEAKGDGTIRNPYNPVAAINAVKDLTWTSSTEYQTTDDVYVKGKISRIANNGTYAASGTNGNASFYISEDGTETDEFYCFRVLYLGNQKYTSGTDIKVGDDVVIYGKLMNYKGNTPETVMNQAYLYSLNGNTEGGGGGDTPGGDTPGGDTGSQMTKSVEGLVVTFTDASATAGESVTYDLTTCGLDHQTENPAFSLNGVSFTFAQGDGSTTPKYWKTGNYDEFRMYAKNVLTIVGSSNIASVVFQCVNNNGNPAVGNEQAYATVNGKTLTFVNDWTSTSSGTQFRFKSVTITYAK